MGVSLQCLSCDAYLLVDPGGLLQPPALIAWHDIRLKMHLDICVGKTYGDPKKHIVAVTSPIICGKVYGD